MKSNISELKLPAASLKVRRSGAGRPLVLLHGGGGPLGVSPLVQQLAAHMEVIEPVHPGFDGTVAPRHVDSVADLAYLYLDMLDALSLEHVTLVGITLGGWVAAEMAVTAPRQLARLALVNAIGIKPGDRDTRDLPDIFAMPPPEVERVLWHNLAYAPSNQSLSEEQWQMAAANRQAHGMYVWDPYMHNPKLKHRLHRIRIPTTLFWGRENRMAAPAYGKAFASLIPDARFELIADAGHSVHMEQPAVLARHIVDFSKP